MKFHTISNKRGMFSDLCREFCILRRLLSGFSVKFAHQNVCCVTSEAIVIMKNYENQKSPTLHFGWYFESLGLISRLLSFQYTPIIC